MRPSGTWIAISPPLSGTARRTIKVELNSRTRSCAGPGGNDVSTTLPSLSVTALQPGEDAGSIDGRRPGRIALAIRACHGACAGESGDALIDRPDSGPIVDVIRNAARPPITSLVRDAPLSPVETMRDIVSCILPQRSAVRVQTRYRPAADRKS